MKKTKKLPLILAFVMVLTSVFTVGASAAKVSDFTDVPATAWYVPELTYATEHGIINGYTTTTFEPKLNMTREEFVKMLCCAVVEDPDSLPDRDIGLMGDVPDIWGRWSTKYMIWALNNDLIPGFRAAGNVYPRQNITREEAAYIMGKYLMDNKISLKGDPDAPASFQDADQISENCAPYVEELRRIGIFEGDLQHYMFPKDNIIRSEAMAVMVRFVKLAKGEVVNPDPSPKPDDIDVSNVDPELVATINGKTYFCGMTEAQLVSQAGQPAEKLLSGYGFQWYAYGTETYKDFFMAAVIDGKVVSLYAVGDDFDYMGTKFGDENKWLAVSLTQMAQRDVGGTGIQHDYADEYGRYRYGQNAFLTDLSKDKIYGIYIKDPSWFVAWNAHNVYDNPDYRPLTRLSDEAVAGECKVVYHTLNAYGVGMGYMTKIPTWNDSFAAKGNADAKAEVLEGAKYSLPEGAKARVSYLDYGASTGAYAAFRMIGSSVEAYCKRAHEIGVGAYLAPIGEKTKWKKGTSWNIYFSTKP